MSYARCIGRHEIADEIWRGSGRNLRALASGGGGEMWLNDAPAFACWNLRPEIVAAALYVSALVA